MNGRRIDVDAVVIGGGHNGLTCAAYLAEAGQSVVVLERGDSVGGAARSERVFPDHDARAVSIRLPRQPAAAADRRRARLDLTLLQRPGAGHGELSEVTARLDERVFPTMTEPLLGVDAFRRVVGDDDTWKDLIERPLGEMLERRFADDEVRGAVLTDGLIGSFTHAHDLQANRCFLHHVVGRGTGDWLLPVGGMGVVCPSARRRPGRGAELRTGVGVRPTRRRPVASARRRHDRQARQVFANVAPAVLARMLGSPLDEPPEGAHVKVNLLLSRCQSCAPRSSRAGVRRHRPRQRGVRPARTGVPAGGRRTHPRRRAVRGVLPLVARPVDPRRRPAGRRRADAHGVCPAPAGTAVP